MKIRTIARSMIFGFVAARFDRAVANLRANPAVEKIATTGWDRLELNPIASFVGQPLLASSIGQPMSHIRCFAEYACVLQLAPSKEPLELVEDLIYRYVRGGVPAMVIETDCVVQLPKVHLSVSNCERFSMGDLFLHLKPIHLDWMEVEEALEYELVKTIV